MHFSTSSTISWCLYAAFVDSEAIEGGCRKGHSVNQSDYYVKYHMCDIVNLQKRKVTTCGLDDVERTRVSINHHLARAPCLTRSLWVLLVSQLPKIVKVLCLMPSLEVPTWFLEQK